MRSPSNYEGIYRQVDFALHFSLANGLFNTIHIACFKCRNSYWFIITRCVRDLKNNQMNEDRSQNIISITWEKKKEIHMVQPQSTALVYSDDKMPNRMPDRMQSLRMLSIATGLNDKTRQFTVWDNQLLWLNRMCDTFCCDLNQIYK